MRIDAHQHFWRYDPVEYAWTGGAESPISKHFMPEDLVPHMKEHGIDGTVAVQARDSLQENDLLLGLAEAHDWILGVVGWVDLCASDVRAQLERYAPHPKFKGVRHMVQSEPDDAFMLREDFGRGIALLEEFGLTYDILIFPRHLPYATELAKRYPNQKFVLDHIAKPDIKNGTLEPWRTDFRELAKLDNVWCKVSGMVTEAAWGSWRPEHFEPYLETAFEAFGEKRIMFGSDWPVCKLSAEYDRTIGLVENHIGSWSPDARNRIMGENCAAFYGLK